MQCKCSEGNVTDIFIERQHVVRRVAGKQRDVFKEANTSLGIIPLCSGRPFAVPPGPATGKIRNIS